METQEWDRRFGFGAVAVALGQPLSDEEEQDD